MSKSSALGHVRMEIGFFGGAYAQSEKVIASSHLSNLHILVREAIQNSYDAREPGSQPEIEFSFRPIDAKSQKYLRERVFTGTPEGVEQLHKDLASDSADWLVISDRGTSGLSGAVSPTIARTREFESGIASKFYRFFWPAQRPEDFKAADGGTFGVGRNIFSLLSNSKTLVVFTRTISDEGQLESRLMAMSRGEPYLFGGKLHEGMHFWGNSTSSPAVPVVGEVAVEIASALGMTDFLGERLGTSIAILNPNMAEYLEDTDEKNGGDLYQDAALEICRAIQLWAWPHIVDETMHFFIREVETSKNVKDYPQLSVLDGFIEAYQRIVSAGHGVEDVELKGKRSATHKVGLIAYNKILDADVHWGDNRVPRQSIALMRKAKLVVKYFSSAQSAEIEPHTAVFVVTDDDADHVFRASEPAAHDEWKEKQQARGQFAEVPRLVAKSIEFFEQYLSRFVRFVGLPTQHSLSSGGFEEIAERLGALLFPAITGGSGDGSLYDEEQEGGVTPAPKVTRTKRTTGGGQASSSPVGYKFFKFDEARYGFVALFRWDEIPTGKPLKVNIDLASRQFADGRQVSSTAGGAAAESMNEEGAASLSSVAAAAFWGTDAIETSTLQEEALQRPLPSQSGLADSEKPGGTFQYFAVLMLQPVERPVSFFCSVGWEK
jgi:hypothetical protein